jgi:predicted ATPase
MALDRFVIKGFKSIAAADVTLRSLNVMIGANGAGKSNLIAAFGLLKEVVDQHLQLAVARRGGASPLLHNGPKHTATMRFELHFGRNGYEADLGAAEGDALFFERESCWFQGEGFAKPYTVPLGAGHRESRLAEEAQHKPGRTPDHVLATLRSWSIYHFHDTSRSAPVKQRGKIDDNASLRPDAANLAAFLYLLRTTEPPAYRRIVAAIRQVAPFFDDFDLRADPLSEGTIQLEWREHGSDTYFNAHALSDGTLRFVCLATLLLQPRPPSLVLLDEPELGLHPFAIAQLAAMLQSAATKTQLLVGTQSVTLMNQLEPDDIVMVDRANGASSFRRIGAQEIASWAEDYVLGELWEKNVFGGRPQPARATTGR